MASNHTNYIKYQSEFLWAAVDDACGTGVHDGVSSMRVPIPAPLIFGVEFAIAFRFL
jgi:hypothetical protein